jgi:hypothetical protein
MPETRFVNKDGETLSFDETYIMVTVEPSFPGRCSCELRPAVHPVQIRRRRPLLLQGHLPGCCRAARPLPRWQQSPAESITHSSRRHDRQLPRRGGEGRNSTLDGLQTHPADGPLCLGQVN